MPERSEIEWLEQLRALAGMADPGPWRVDRADDDMAMSAHFVARGEFRAGRWPNAHQVIAVTLLQSPNLALSELARQNANFIAAARDGVPRLLAEIERLFMQRQHAAESLRRILPVLVQQLGDRGETIESLRRLLSQLERA